MSTTDLSPTLVRNVIMVWGTDGKRWLAELPGILAAVARDWQLDVGAPFTLSYHYVAPATRADGSPAVLKLGVPGESHLVVEAATLTIYDGHGAVRLLAHDPDRGALLLERADPGGPASALVPERDEEATDATLAVMRRLLRPAPPHCPLPPLTDEADSFPAYLSRYPAAGPLPRHVVERAGRLFDELCASAPGQVVLHGDLHHDNIVRATREPWLAIDPHGVIGDPGYELGALLYNPDPDRRDRGLLDLVPARLEQLADGLAMPMDRVVAWAFVKAVLSDVWTANDGVVPADSRALDVALMLLPRLP